MDREELEGAIRAAFPLRPFPPITLKQACLGDETLTRQIPKAEWEAARCFDHGQPWNEYSADDLVALELGVAHLDEASFAYYLPAYLLFAIKHIHRDALSRASFAVTITISSVTDRSDYTLSRLATLTAPQRDAVIAFLEWVVVQEVNESQDAAKSLARHWKKK